MRSRRSNFAVKLITYSEELVDGKPLYAFSNSLPVKALNREPAGYAFHSAARKLHGCAEKPNDSKGTDKKVGDDEEKEYVHPSFNPYAKKGKKKTKRPDYTYQTHQQQDHYELLGLRNLRYLATEDQIKKGYREAALKHHPDKLANLILAEETEEAKESKKDEIESRFRAIQEAYEVLMDPTRRKIFDSTDEFNFDDTELSPQEFFKVFGPAFKRITRWSSANQRVPDLGDENTRDKDVDKFYSFWFGFKCSREFTYGERHDPEKANSRQERRWMERENAKRNEKARKEEDVRIRNLVDNAYRIDPRIAKRKEERTADKQRKKEAKVVAERKREEEAAAVAAEVEKRRREEAQQQEKAKEKERELLCEERTRLKTLSARVLAQRLVTEEEVENLCMSLSIEEMQSLNDIMGSKQGVELAKVIRDHEANSKEKESEKANAEPPTKLDNTQKKEDGDAESTNTEKKNQPWSKEEIDKLRKGIIKYPKGTSRRWEVISDYIGTGRSVEEILKATKTVILQKPDSAKAFESFLEKRKPTVSIASPLSTREEELGESLPMGNNGEASDGWSSVEERALVRALKTFPKETSQRWERVAAAVPGKTVIQCKKKFAELKELIRSKKTGV